MSDFKKYGEFDGVENFTSKKTGKIYNVIFIIVNHKPLKVFDFDNSLTAILAENNVQKHDKIYFSGDLDVGDNGFLEPRIKSIGVD